MVLVGFDRLVVFVDVVFGLELLFAFCEFEILNLFVGSGRSVTVFPEK